MVESEAEKMMRLFIDAGEKGDPSILLKFLSDEVKYIDAYGIEHGKKGLLTLFSGLSSQWPDRKYHLDNWVVQGDTVWIESTNMMTHVNEFHGIPPTNKKIKNQIVWIVEFEAGKIVQIREYEKQTEYMIRQLQE